MYYYLQVRKYWRFCFSFLQLLSQRFYTVDMFLFIFRGAFKLKPAKYSPQTQIKDSLIIVFLRFSSNQYVTWLLLPDSRRVRWRQVVMMHIARWSPSS